MHRQTYFPNGDIPMENTSGNRRPACAVVTLPDPDNTWASSHLEVNGTLEIRCESPSYPTFKVIFDEESPSDKRVDHVYEGSIEHPVVIRVQKEGDFSYTVQQFHRNGTDSTTWEFKTRINPCQNCPGGNQGAPPKI